MSLAKRLKRLWKLSEVDFDFTPTSAQKQARSQIKNFFDILNSKRGKIVDMQDPLDIDLGEETK